ncbi:transposase [Corynebacterium gallinarum]|uniref:transposase n=1 Tax=Corynebacterium gallinarum TaxID=2762214 RepID=UPI00296F6222|nr:transposase [Corynebacterium gallinarum]
MGRSRGGLSSKIHASVDGHGRPLSLVVTGGRRHDGMMLPTVLKDIHVPCRGPERARSRPDTVLADRGYATTVIVVVILEARDSVAARQGKGSKGGRQPAFNAQAYQGHNVVKQTFASAKQWRGLDTRYDKLTVVYRGAVVLCAVIT